MKRQTGIYQKLGDLNNFIPYPLPPENPDFQFNKEIIDLYGKAMHKIGSLNETARRLPNIERFIKAYCLKESILSSAIEGINTTLAEVFTKVISYNKSQTNKQTQLVLNYSQALDVALNMINEKNFFIVSRVILKSHEILMSGGDGDKTSPGQFRRQQVRVGNLVTPPANKIEDLISDLEKFINDHDALPVLIKAGLMHVQFETIHPFLDGNGRIGRLLIVLMLIESKTLLAPILYPSVAFKKYHAEYYHRLDQVRTQGDFEGWILFYLKVITQSADDACKRAKKIEDLENYLKEKIKNSEIFSNKEQAYEVLSLLFQFPVISISELEKSLNKSYNTVSNMVQKFIDIKVLKQLEDKMRNRMFHFVDYLDLLNQEF